MGAPSGLERRQSKLRKTVLGELQFMLHHFTQMLKAAEKGNSPLMIAGNHSRLSSFIPHLQQTIDQLHRPIPSEQALDELERHLEKTLLPVKRRLESQLRQTPHIPLPTSGSSGDLSKRSGDEPASPESRESPETGPTKKRHRPEDDDEADALGCISDFFGADSPKRRQRSWDDVPVVTESSDSGDSTAGKPDPLVHGAASAPVLQVSRPPALRQRTASIQVLPERVEYHCANCGEVYTSRCSTVYNPWWSLVRQACPKCEQRQFPWIDISSAINQITHRPFAADDDDDAAAPEPADDNNNDDDDDDDEEVAKTFDATAPSRPAVDVEEEDDDDEAFLILERSSAPTTDDDVVVDFAASSVSALPDDEGDFADAPDGARLSRSQATALLALFDHARSCPGLHASRRHANVCTAAKYVMLHARDCPGGCAFDWCGPVKRLLAHVVRCSGRSCVVCGAEAARAVPTDTGRDDGAELPARRKPLTFNTANADSAGPEMMGRAIPRIIIRKPPPCREPHPPPPPPPAAAAAATAAAAAAAKGGRTPLADADFPRDMPPPPRRLKQPGLDYWDSLQSTYDAPLDDHQAIIG
ncbi:hypothetical protein CTAYLR_001009 [Chrysophaeum taylorii]|uniref:TAZ-type domain-containing protein n=1 Tax=Chrysophaeum taylorii TaxID=2483200 RepID=A0AAD7UI29_9STRA|nr:hypothetical protein CTAYLR_001009 [Chrysophaeum taylorii]